MQYACYAYYIVGPCTELLYIGSDITQQINDVVNVLLKLCVLCIASLAFKALSHGAIFLATCNAILLLVDVKLANTRFHQFAKIFLTYQTFVTCISYIRHLHLLRVELRCKLPGKLHRVTGPSDIDTFLFILTEF